MARIRAVREAIRGAKRFLGPLFSQAKDIVFKSGGKKAASTAAKKSASKPGVPRRLLDLAKRNKLNIGLTAAATGSVIHSQLSDRGLLDRARGAFGGDTEQDLRDLERLLAKDDERTEILKGQQDELQSLTPRTDPFTRAFGSVEDRAGILGILLNRVVPAAVSLGLPISDLLGDATEESPFLASLTAGERLRLREASNTTGPASAGEGRPPIAALSG